MMNYTSGLIIFLLIIMSCKEMLENQTNALTDLNGFLVSESEWIKVHAAEFLLWTGQDSSLVYNTFIEEESKFDTISPYRIGIWRVLTQATSLEKEKQHYISKIRAVHQDPDAADRLHAIETLAKLKVPVVMTVDESLSGSMRLYSFWNYALGSKEKREEVKESLLADLVSNNFTELEMQVTSYILRFIGHLSEYEYLKITEWMAEERLPVSLQSNLLATLLIAAPPNKDLNETLLVKDELIALRNNADAMNHIMMALARCGDQKDADLIEELYKTQSDNTLEDYNSDLHATAAYMLLSSTKR